MTTPLPTSKPAVKEKRPTVRKVTSVHRHYSEARRQEQLIRLVKGALDKPDTWRVQRGETVPLEDAAAARASCLARRDAEESEVARRAVIPSEWVYQDILSAMRFAATLGGKRGKPILFFELSATELAQILGY